MRYITMTLTPGMFDGPATVSVRPISLEEARQFVRGSEAKSYVRNPVVAMLLSEDLGVRVRASKSDVTLHPGDEVLVCVFKGGTVDLEKMQPPPKWKLYFFLAEVKDGK